MAPGGGGNIKVVVRVRPFNSRGEPLGNPSNMGNKAKQGVTGSI